jgi:hypothetical protein
MPCVGVEEILKVGRRKNSANQPPLIFLSHPQAITLSHG